MIHPLIGETEWSARLVDLPEWQPPFSDTLIVAPHPDDETLAVGGLIARLTSHGTRVRVVAVTDGERAYGETPGLGELREQEQTAALHRLGVDKKDIVRLRLPDSSVTAYESDLAGSLLSLATSKTHIVAPWTGDFHPDHEACGRASASAAKVRGSTLSSYFFWTWHRGTVELLEGMQLVGFQLNSTELEAKREALICHQSQLEHESGSPILPERLLGPARRSYEVYLR